MSFEFSRRTFLKGAVVAATAGVATSCTPSTRDRLPASIPELGDVLQLPPGFSQRVLSRSGLPILGGGKGAGKVAAKHDGMTAVAHNGNTILLRNHE